jgi:hypothetical protein
MPTPSIRGHGVGGVADAEQARPEPAPQPVDLDAQHAHVVPGPERVHAVAEEGHQVGDRGAEAIQSSPVQLIEGVAKQAVPGL